MLEFNDPVVNAIDQSISKAIVNKVWHLTADDSNLDSRFVTIANQRLINFSLNSCLAFESDPKVKAGIVNVLDRFNASFIVSRAFVSPPQFEEFEILLHKLFESYPVVTSSTTLGHLAALPVLIQENDLVILDFFVHNSVRTAVKVINNKITTKTVAHNDTKRLEIMIKKAQTDPNINNIWYLADGVYSMLGDLAPVKSLERLLKKYENFYAYIDDAHGMSIMGKHGRGYILGSFAKQPEKMVVAISLSKSFGIGCGGAIILPNVEWQRKVKYCGSTWMYSSPIAVPMLGAAIASAKIHCSDEISKRQEKLQELISLFIELVKYYGLPISTESRSPIFFINIGSAEYTIKVVKNLIHKGFFLSACIYPIVAKNSCGARLVITLYHSKDDIKQLAEYLQYYLSNL